jgi:hypothetical protein
MPHMVMAHDVDPKQAILDKIGDISGVRLFFRNILIGVYVRPKVTASGIHLSDNTVQEDVYQGKVGVVLKMGPGVLKDGDGDADTDNILKVGDWVVVRPSDYVSLEINKTPCRMGIDSAIRMVIPHPDVVW